MLRMTTLPPNGGDTLFSSAYSHYDMLSLPMKEFLSGLRATHSGAMFRQQARRHGFDLHLGPRGAPENVGDDFEASHPIVRTNAVTGFNGLFVNQTFTERIEGLGFDESKMLLEYLFKLQAQAHGTFPFSLLPLPHSRILRCRSLSRRYGPLPMERQRPRHLGQFGLQSLRDFRLQ